MYFKDYCSQDNLTLLCIQMTPSNNQIQRKIQLKILNVL